MNEEIAMCCNRSKSIWLGGLLGLVILGTAVWYLRLPDWRKRHIQSLARQLPDMPGRYMA